LIQPILPIDKMHLNNFLNAPSVMDPPDIEFDTLDNLKAISYYMRDDGGKGKAYLFIAQTGRYIYRFGATSDVSLSPC
jgi:hypothetical protein